MRKLLVALFVALLMVGWGEDVKDVKDGLYTEYYANGQKKSERNYKDGKADGLSTRWWVNGRKMEEGTPRPRPPPP